MQPSFFILGKQNNKVNKTHDGKRYALLPCVFSYISMTKNEKEVVPAWGLKNVSGKIGGGEKDCMN